MELHKGSQIGKAHVVSAGGHTGDRAAGAVAGVDCHVELLVLEITFGQGRQEQGGRAFKAPVELELDGGVLRLGSAHGQYGSQ